MNEIERFYIEERSREMSTPQLRRRLGLHVSGATNAMSQSAAAGNLGAATIVERELRSRGESLPKIK